MKRTGFLLTSVLAACASQIYNADTFNGDKDFKLPSGAYQNIIQDKEIIESINRVKSVYDKYLGFKKVNFFCYKNTEKDDIYSSVMYNGFCSKVSGNYLYNEFKNQHVTGGKKLTQFKVFKDFYDNEYDNFTPMTSDERQMVIDFSIAHELGHLYIKDTKNYPKMVNLLDIGVNNGDVSVNDIQTVRSEIFADTLASTFMKTYYKDEPQKLVDFMKKVRYFRINESNFSVNNKDPHFFAELYKDGVDFALSFDLTPTGFARMIKAVDDVTLQSIKYYNVSNSESSIKSKYDFIHNRLMCHLRKNKEQCYLEFSVDKKISKMPYPEFKSQYEKSYNTYGKW